MKNKISSFAYVSPNAIFGKGNIIMDGVIIRDNVVIGDNNIIFPNAMIGLTGEVKGETEPNGKVIIGSDNTIRERVSIHSPSRSKETVIGNGCYIMNGSHIAHDCKLYNDVVLAPYVILGGMVEVGYHANLGMGVRINPRNKVGKVCMIGSGAVVTKDVPNFEKWSGVPASKMGYNIIGMQRVGLSPQQIDIICE